MKSLCIIAVILNINCAFIIGQDALSYEKQLIFKENFNYQEISFYNNDIQLYGTLIEPITDYSTIVIIVPGSGKDTRNSHFVLTERLLKSNIAVYRYDDRGTGESEGQFTDYINILASDLKCAINILIKKNVSKGKKIGLIGHSLGGLVTMECIKQKVPVDFLIQLSTPVKGRGDFIEHQILTNNKFNNAFKGESQDVRIDLFNSIRKTTLENPESTTHEIYKIYKKKTKYKKDQYARFINIMNVDLIKRDYQELYININIPMLYIIGSLDTFVNPKNSISILAQSDNKNIESILFKDLNHYLVSHELIEMNKAVYNLSPIVSNTIIEWLNKLNNVSTL